MSGSWQTTNQYKIVEFIPLTNVSGGKAVFLHMHLIFRRGLEGSIIALEVGALLWFYQIVPDSSDLYKCRFFPVIEVGFLYIQLPHLWYQS